MKRQYVITEAGHWNRYSTKTAPKIPAMYTQNYNRHDRSV